MKNNKKIKSCALRGVMLVLLLGGITESSEGQGLIEHPSVVPPVSYIMARDYYEQHLEASLDSSNTGTDVTWKIASPAFGGVFVGPTASVARPRVGMSKPFVARENLFHNAEPEVIYRYKGFSEKKTENEKK